MFVCCVVLCVVISIRIDVERTYADDPYFASFDTRIVMQRILLIWAAEHPNDSYRQGFNELLAMIVIALRKDHTKPPPKEYVSIRVSIRVSIAIDSFCLSDVS